MPKFDYEADRFIGMDTDYFGDGDSDTRPKDVYGDQVLARNLRYLARGKTSSVRTLEATNNAFDAGAWTGERPYASIDWATPFKFGVDLEPKTEGYDFILYAIADSQNGGVGAGVDWQLVVKHADGRTLGQASGEIALGTEFEAHELSVDLFEPYSGATNLATVYFSFRSQDDGAPGSAYQVQVTSANQLRWTIDPGTPLSNQTNGPGSANPEVLYLVGDEEGLIVDIFGVDDSDPKKNGEEYIFPDRNATPELIRTLATPGLFNVRYKTYLQIRSYQLQVRYSADSLSDVAQEELGAKRLAFGDREIEQASGITAYMLRPTPLVIGSAHYEDSRQRASWPADYHMRFPIAVADGSAHSLLDDSFHVTTDNPITELILFFIATIDLGGGVGVGQTELSSGDSDWDIDATLTQFDLADSDWATPTAVASITATRKVATFVTDWRRSRFLRAKAIMHDWAATNGFIFGGTYDTGTHNQWQHSIAEGLLYAEDFRLITAVAVPLECSGLDYTDNLYATRLEVEATYVNNSLELDAVGGANDVSQLGEAMHLTLVGATLNERASI